MRWDLAEKLTSSGTNRLYGEVPIMDSGRYLQRIGHTIEDKEFMHIYNTRFGI
jgi:hypothetical protein